jgi:hypothetical protein
LGLDGRSASACAQTSILFLMSAETARRAESVARLRSLSEIEVRGRAERVEVFSAEAILPVRPSSTAGSRATASE